MKCIIGVPGAGKTERAIEIARRHTSIPYYISFSSESSSDAKERFGKSAFCSSIHSFCRKQLRINPNRITDNWDLITLSNSLKASTNVVIDDDDLPSFLCFFKIFLNSELSVEQSKLLFSDDRLSDIKKQLSNRFHAALKGLWRWLTNSDSAMLHHDIYLKIAALKQDLKVDFDLLLVDEFQDLNEVMFSLLENLERNNPNLQIILFGDYCQQIHSYRGSTNKILSVPIVERLNKSRRFGERLASLINSFMLNQSIHGYTPIIGEPQINTEIKKYNAYSDIISFATSKKRPTCICRTNAEVVFAAIELSSKNAKVAIKGNVLRELQFFQSVLDLKYGKGALKSTYGNFELFKSFAATSNDYLLQVSVSLVSKITNRQAFSELKSKLVSQKDAQILLTNVHQSKGLQFRHVFIGFDFNVKFKDGKFEKMKDRESSNVLYTAISRAKMSLHTPHKWWV